MSNPAAAAAAPVPEGMASISEGRATVLFPNKNEVFYNKVQCFNRDLSILMTKLYVRRRRLENAAERQKEVEKNQRQWARYKGLSEAAQAKQREPRAEPKPVPWEGLRVLEALAATGLRSVRYWNEIPEADDDLDFITVNDLDEAAVDSIRRNVLHNGLDPERVRPNHADANMAMHMSRMPDFGRPYDVIDLDPYGTAAPFLDAALQSVHGDGGLLAITCTDKSVLCGNNPEVCLAKYGSTGLRGPLCHEMGVRILLSTVAKAAARYGRYIVPVASFSIDFYVRVFVRVYTSAAQVKMTASKLSNVFQCVGCGSFALQPLGVCTVNGRSVKHTTGRGPPVDQHCAECGSRYRVGGPIWNAPMHDPEWLREALDTVKKEPARYATSKRILAMVGVAETELPDVPLLYGFSAVAKAVGTAQPKLSVFRSALLNAGFRVSGSHTDPGAIKTDAPPKAVMDIMRCYVRDVQPMSKKPAPDSVSGRLLAKEPELKADFTHRREAENDAVPRFLPNPEENWGPKARAAGKKAAAPEDPTLSVEERMALKRKANQGKRHAKKQRQAEAAKKEKEAGAAAAAAAAAGKE